jgi:N12 class adenine-specific DNA methylase
MALDDVLNSLREEDRQLSATSATSSPAVAEPSATKSLADLAQEIEAEAAVEANRPKVSPNDQSAIDASSPLDKAGDVLKSYASGAGNLLTNIGQASVMANNEASGQINKAVDKLLAVPAREQQEKLSSPRAVAEAEMSTPATLPSNTWSMPSQESLGKSLQEAGELTSKYWKESMSPGGQALQGMPFYEAPGLSNKFHAAVLQAAQSLPDTVAIGLVGSRVAQAAKIGQAVPVVAGALARMGLPARFAEKAAEWSLNGAVFGTAEGADAGLSNAYQVGKDIDKIPGPELAKKSPKFVEYLNSLDPSLPPATREKQAREMLKEDAEAFALYATTAMSTATGTVAGGGIFDKAVTSKNWLLNRVISAGKEGNQEFWQSGFGEKLPANLAMQQADNTITPMTDVLKEGAAGAGPGAVMGLFGGGGHADTGSKGAKEAEKQNQISLEKNKAVLELKRQNLSIQELTQLKNNPADLEAAGYTQEDIDIVMNDREDTISRAKEILGGPEGQGPLSKVAGASINMEQARLESERADQRGEPLYPPPAAPEPVRPDNISDAEWSTQQGRSMLRNQVAVDPRTKTMAELMAEYENGLLPGGENYNQAPPQPAAAVVDPLDEEWNQRQRQLEIDRALKSGNISAQEARKKLAEISAADPVNKEIEAVMNPAPAPEQQTVDPLEEEWIRREKQAQVDRALRSGQISAKAARDRLAEIAATDPVNKKISEEMNLSTAKVDEQTPIDPLEKEWKDREEKSNIDRILAAGQITAKEAKAKLQELAAKDPVNKTIDEQMADYWAQQESGASTDAPAPYTPVIAQTLADLEQEGRSPSDVTRDEWVKLQREERRRLGQDETSGTAAAPYSDYEQFHEMIVKEDVDAGRPVPVAVLNDYPELFNKYEKLTDEYKMIRHESNGAVYYEPVPVAEKPTKKVTTGSPAVTTGATDKNPWQMTPSEYIKARLAEDDGQNNAADIRATARTGHALQVKAAVEKGEDIPDAVLKAYNKNQWAKNAIARKQGVESGISETSELGEGIQTVQGETAESDDTSGTKGQVQPGGPARGKDGGTLGQDTNKGDAKDIQSGDSQGDKAIPGAGISGDVAAPESKWGKYEVRQVGEEFAIHNSETGKTGETTFGTFKTASTIAKGMAEREAKAKEPAPPASPKLTGKEKFVADLNRKGAATDDYGTSYRVVVSEVAGKEQGYKLEITDESGRRSTLGNPMYGGWSLSEAIDRAAYKASFKDDASEASDKTESTDKDSLTVQEPQTGSSDYTQQELEKLLADLKAKAKSQGQVVNDRLLSQIKNVEKLVNQGRAPQVDQAPAAAPEKEKTASASPDKFASNTIFTSDKVAAARARLAAKRNTLSSGFDPEMLADIFTIGGGHFESGIREFSKWSKAVLDDIGVEFKQYLRGAYENLRHVPGLNTEGMNTSSFVEEYVNGEEFNAIYKDTKQIIDNSETDTDNVSKGNEYQQSDGEINNDRDTATGQEADGEPLRKDNAAVGDTGNPPLEGMATESNGENGAKQPSRGGSTEGSQKGSGGSSGPATGKKGPRKVPGGRRGNAEEVHTPATGKGSAGRNGSRRIEPTGTPAVNFRITEDVNLGEGGAVTKYRDNITAIRIIKALRLEQRRATPDEQRSLSRYVGWGSLSNAFRNGKTGEIKDGWERQVAELEDLLTKEELTTARNSTQNAHYTSHDVVTSMWYGLDILGFNGGVAVEPSVGTGNFIGLIPEKRTGDTHFLAAEYDGITAGIAKNLYPQSAVFHTPFENLPIPDNSVDLFIGNPPYGQKSLKFAHNPDLNRFSIHNQFVLAGIDALRPGGVQAVVVSRYLLDTSDTTVRAELSSKAKLLGAFRLPETAFKTNAGTTVIADIIFLQKFTEAELATIRESKIFNTPPWVETSKVIDPAGGDPIVVNSYFRANPENIIGKLDRTGSQQHGNDVTVHLDEGNMKEILERAMRSTLPSDVIHRETTTDRTKEQFKRMADAMHISLAGLEEGSLEVNNDGGLDQIYLREIEGGEFVLSRRTLTAKSVWSPSISMGVDGRWYRVVALKDEKGNPLKQTSNGRVTNRNIYGKEYFDSEKDIPATARLGEDNIVKLRKGVDLTKILQDQINIEIAEDSDQKQLDENRKKLRRQYEAFVEKHGYLNDDKNAKLFAEMANHQLLLSLEAEYNKPITRAKAAKLGVPERAASVVTATILSERAGFPYVPPTQASTPSEALAVSLSEYGKVDIERISGLLGKTEDEAVKDLHETDNPLIFKDPETNTWETADEYLGGNVVKKLNAAKEAGLERNVKALESVQPKEWGAENVSVGLGATWVPMEIYQDFVESLTGASAVVKFQKLTNSFYVRSDTKGPTAVQWNTKKKNVVDIVESIMNSRSLKVTVTDSEGKVHVDQEATDAANDKALDIKEQFESWIFQDGDRRKTLVDLFNKKYNVITNKQRNGSHLTLPGMSSVVKLRRHQINGIWRGIVDRFVMYDHAVGAGKTYTGIARAMERKRMGFSSKPMIVVPNHIVEQFASDVYKLFPGAKLLAATKKDMSKDRRRRFFSKVATGNWDIVIMPHSSFKLIGISPKTEIRYLEDELQLAIQAVKEAESEAEADGTSGWRKPFTVKQAESLRDGIIARLESVKAKGGKKDRILTFEQLGVDDITIDESHEFKNLFYHSNLNVSGMNPKAGSGKAFDLWSKIRVLNESKTGSACFMTGTPISNSAVEMYGILRYLAPDYLKDMGLEHFDAWRSQFVPVTTQFEPTDSGKGLKEVNRLGRDWSNMRSLMTTYYSIADSVSNDDIIKWFAEDNPGKRFPIPLVKDGGRRGVNVKPTPAQEKAIEEIVSGFQSLPAISNPKKRNAERLRLMDRAKKVSLDIRALDPHSTSKEEGGKLEKVSEEVARIYHDWHKDKGTQLVFLDRSVPKSSSDKRILKAYDDLVAKMEEAERSGDDAAAMAISDKLEKYNAIEMETMRVAQSGGWNAYQQIKDNLVSMGIPANEIRFIHEAGDNAEKKQELFDEVNSGAVRILIGNTPRMGAGTNVQERLVALHHVDVTYKPSDIEQREGRIIRQGNSLYDKYGADKFEVEILAYTTELTVDAKLWSLNATKLKMINGIRSYNGEFNMEFDDEDSVSMAEIAAIASGDPMQLERVKLSSEIDRLKRQKKNHEKQNWGHQDRLDTANKTIENNPGLIKFYEHLAPKVAKYDETLYSRAEERTPVTIEGNKYSYEKRGEAFKLVREMKEEAKKAVEEDKKAKKPRVKGEVVDTHFKIEIDGTVYRSATKAEAALDAAFGDDPPVEIKFDGQTFIQRKTAREAILKKIEEKITGRDGEVPDTSLGKITIRGVDLDISFEVDDGAEISAKSNGKDLSRQVTIYYEYEQKGQDGKYRRLSSFISGVVTEKGEIPRGPWTMIFYKINSELEGVGQELRYSKKKLEEAKNSKPELEKLVGRPFPKLEELAQKETSLDEVEKQLSSAGGRSGSEQQQADADEAWIDEAWETMSDMGFTLIEKDDRYLVIAPGQFVVTDEITKNMAIREAVKWNEQQEDDGGAYGQGMRSEIMAPVGDPADIAKEVDAKLGAGASGSVNIVGTQADALAMLQGVGAASYSNHQDQDKFKVMAPEQEPVKTIKAYKLFRTLKTQPGKLFPLFIGKSVETPVGVWVAAENIPTKGFADRPGWHAGMFPSAPHLMRKDGSMPGDRVWAEVELPADVDWQSIADGNKGKMITGTSKANQGDIKDKVPTGGHYKFNTSKSQDPNWSWVIGGAIKINRLLTMEEVNGINEAAGLPVVQYSKAGHIQAFTIDGQIHMVADGISKGDAFQVFLHEVAHATRLGFKSSKIWAGILANIQQLSGTDTITGKAIAEARARVPANTPEKNVPEEILAYLIENNRNEIGIVRRFIAMIKAALVKMKINPSILKPDDFKALAIMAARGYAARGPIGGEGGPKPSLSTPFKAVDRNSPELKRWMGNSQVAGPVYHGSPETFWTFDKEKLGGRGNISPVAGLGHFFATDRTEAQAYAGLNGENREFFVKIENPKRMDAYELPNFRSAEEARAYAKRQQLAGFDGIILADEGHVIVFENNQIKSAEINTGEFSAENPDVRFSVSTPTQNTREEVFARIKEARNKSAESAVKVQVDDIKANGLNVENETKFFKEVAAKTEDDSELTGKGFSWFKSNVGAVARKAYGALTLRQIREIFADRLPQIHQFYDATRFMAAESNGLMKKADDVYQEWAKLDRAESDELADIMAMSTISAVNPDGDITSHLDINKANQRIEKYRRDLDGMSKIPAAEVTEKQRKYMNNIPAYIMARQGKIAQEKSRMDAHARLTKRFNKLSPEAKLVWSLVRGQYDSHLAKLFTALQERIERSSLSAKDKKATIDKVRLRYDRYVQEGPYFPLSRFGDYIAIAKKGAEREVHSFDSKVDADRFSSGRRAKGWAVQQKTKKEYSPQTDGVSGQFMTGIINAVNDSKMKAPVKQQLLDDINQMFIKALPDLSHRKHFSHRKKVAGYSRDQMRAFASNMQHSSHHIGRINHADKMMSALEEIEKGTHELEDNVDATVMTDVYNELVKRNQQIMNPDISPVAQALTSAGFFWNIGPSIASAVVNITQTPMVAFPLLAAKFNSGRKAFSTLSGATADFFSSPWTGDAGFNLQKNTKISQLERDMIDALIEDGTIDVTQAHSLAQAAGPDNLNMLTSKHGHIAMQVMKVTSYPFHIAEVANRQITALAAYRMAIDHGKTNAEAVNLARELTLDSHFDYSQANRARFMEGNVQRVLFLFKQYSQQMTYLLARSFHQAVKGETKAVKVEAAKRLLGIVGGHFIFSGAMGMPMVEGVMFLVEMLVNMLGDDDEPWDWEASFRNMLADNLGKDLGEAVAKGPSRLLPGVGALDLSSRMSLSDLWFRTPDKSLEGRDEFNAYVNMFAGPLATNALNMKRGLDAMAEGQTFRGVEMMVPKFVKDIMKTMRFAREGVKNWKNDQLIESLTMTELVGQLIGFSSSRSSEMYAGISAVKGQETALSRRRSHLVNTWVDASNKGDTQKADRVMIDIMAFNEKNPVLGIRRSTLLQSNKARQKVRSQTKNGVYLPGTKDELRNTGRFSNM